MNRFPKSWGDQKFPKNGKTCLLLNWPRPIEEQPPHGWVLEIGSLVAPEVTEGAGNNLMVALKYLARIFCKKIGSDCSFLAGMVVQTFCLRL